MATKVSIDNRSATNHTIFEVITRDRRDLLFRIARTLQKSDLSIELAKVNTEGDRVADVFYVADAAGGKISDRRRTEQIKERILTTIAAMEQDGGN